MLRITTSASTEAAKDYFRRALAKGDYYMNDTELLGTWGGKGSVALGLSGEVERDAFLAMVGNRRPNGERLTVITAPNRRPGYDFTFDVPKSVSLAYLINGDERIKSAMQRAVMETMDELEHSMQTRVRVGGADTVRTTGNAIWADFTHLTTRPIIIESNEAQALVNAYPWLADYQDSKRQICLPDPHLHSHVFVINATFDEVENKWKAGEFGAIKRDATYYQAAYHVRLAGELQKLGYNIIPTDKAFELEGIDRSLVEKYSRRTAEIEAHADLLGITDATAKAALGAKTRRAKSEDIPLKLLKSLWRQRVNDENLTSMVKVSELALTRGICTPSVSLKAIDTALSFALDKELERASAVPEKRLLASALMRGISQVSVSATWQALKFHKGLLKASVDGQNLVSTHAVLDEELNLRQIIRQSRGQCPPLIQGEYKFQHEYLLTPSEKNREQRHAANHIFSCKDWVMGIVGRAGTGKTALLNEIALGIKAIGRGMVLCAPTAEASRGVLRQEGFTHADTVQKLLNSHDLQSSLTGKVLWVDEAGMLGNQDLLKLLNVAKAKGALRVVLSGDPSQIRSVNRGDPLLDLENNAGLSVARLSNIQRQTCQTLKGAVLALSQGNVEKGFALLESQQAIVEVPTQEAHKKLAQNYVEARNYNPSRVLVICPTHREGEELSSAIRSELIRAGKLWGKTVKVPRLTRLPFTEAEKTLAQTYTEGQVIEFKRSSEKFRSGERVRITHVNPATNQVFALRNDDSILPIPLQHPKRFTVYQKNDLIIAQGETLRITDSALTKDGCTRLANGQTVHVESVLENGDLQLTNGKVLDHNFGHFNYGYVSTADSAQAKTVDTVLVSVGEDSLGATDLRRIYVSLSRARFKAVLFTPDKLALLEATKRETQRPTATEIARRSGVISFQNTIDILRRSHPVNKQASPTAIKPLPNILSKPYLQPELDIAL